MLKTIMLLILVSMLSACSNSGQFDALKMKLENIKERPKGRLEPPPEFKAYKTFTYGAAALRSPFSPPVDVELAKLPAGRSDVKPDLNRSKEALESFSLDSLQMVGTLKRPGGTLFALLKDPDNGLHRIAEGNHAGRNHGKVLAVTSAKIDVIEIVSDGQDGWIERPRTISIAE